MSERIQAILMIAGLVSLFVSAIVAIFWSHDIGLYLVLAGLGILMIAMIWDMVRLGLR